MGGGNPSPPPAPDYAGSAREQGAANIEAARLSGKMNNPNVYSPYGTQTVKFGEFNQSAYDAAMSDYQASQQSGPYLPGGISGTLRGSAAPNRSDYTTADDQPTLYQTFSPGQQALYDQDLATKTQVGKLGLQGAKSLEGVIGTPIDYSNLNPNPNAYQAGGTIAPQTPVAPLDPNALPAQATVQGLTPTDLSALPGQAALTQAPAVLDRSSLPGMAGAYAPGALPAMPQSSEALRQQAYTAALARPMQDLAMQREDLQSNLVAKGIRGGSRAYEYDMDRQARAENDARQQAVLAADEMAARQYGMDLQTRQQGQQEAIQNATLGYQQQMGLRATSLDEQMKQFTQGMQAGELTYGQQEALRNQSMQEQMARFGQQEQASQLGYQQQAALREQSMQEQAARFGQEMSVGTTGYGQRLQSQQQQAAQAQLQFQQMSDLRRAQQAEYLSKRQTPLNEISAALSNTQVQNPFTMPGYSQNTNIAPPPIFEATKAAADYGSDIYNAQQQAASSRMSGMMQLGGAAMGAGAMVVV